MDGCRLLDEAAVAQEAGLEDQRKRWRATTAAYEARRAETETQLVAVRQGFAEVPGFQLSREKVSSYLEKQVELMIWQLMRLAQELLSAASKMQTEMKNSIEEEAREFAKPAIEKIIQELANVEVS